MTEIPTRRSVDSTSPVSMSMRSQPPPFAARMRAAADGGRTLGERRGLGSKVQMSFFSPHVRARQSVAASSIDGYTSSVRASRQKARVGWWRWLPLMRRKSARLVGFQVAAFRG